MPSTLPGFQSGGQLLVSGNPWSGNVPQPGGVLVRVSKAVSGLVYLGYSGGITLASGGALSSGGMLDAMELATGEERSFKLGANGIGSIYAVVPPTVSGTMRIFWEPY